MKKLMCVVLSAAMVLGSSCMALADDEVLEESYGIENVVDAAGDVELVIPDGINVTQQVEGYSVSVRAEEGVFPQGTEVVIKRADAAQEAEVKNAIFATLASDEMIAESATFDFEFVAPGIGAVEPDSKAVDVSIVPAGSFAKFAAQDGSDVKVYHYTNDGAIEAVDSSYDAAMGAAFAASEFSSYTLVVTMKAKQDFKAPVIKSIKQTGKTVVKGDANSKIEFTGDIKDALSGVYNAYMYFDVPGKKGETVSVYFTDKYWDSQKSSSVKYADKKWHGTFTADTDAVVGKYKISYIVAVDRVGNRVYYNSSNMPKKFKKLAFTVKNPPLTSVTYSNITMTPAVFDQTAITDTSDWDDKYIKVKLTTSIDSANIDRIEVKLVMKDGDMTRTRTSYAYGGYSTEVPNSYEANFYMMDQSDIGTWKIESFTLLTKDGKLNFQGRSDNSLPAAAKNLKSVVKGKKSANTIKIKSLKFDKAKIKAGKGDVTVTATLVTDKPITSGNVSLYYKKDNTYYMIRSSSVYNSEGSTSTKLTFAIPKNQPNGKYTIAYCDVDVKDGDYISFYDKKYNSTAKNKLTKALKKVKLTVKR